LRFSASRAGRATGDAPRPLLAVSATDDPRLPVPSTDRPGEIARRRVIPQIRKIDARSPLHA